MATDDKDPLINENNIKIADLRFANHEHRRKHKMRVILDFIIENQHQKPVPTHTRSRSPQQQLEQTFPDEIERELRKDDRLSKVQSNLVRKAECDLQRI